MWDLWMCVLVGQSERERGEEKIDGVEAAVQLCNTDILWPDV